MREMKIGLLGFGTIGAGVVEGLSENADLISGRIGVCPIIAKIADLDIESDRGVAVEKGLLTKDAVSVIEDPQIDIIVELIGGTSVARDLVKRALKAGKPVVTANKALLAKYGKELFDLAEENNVDLYFEASVGGGIPIIRSLREGLVSNRFKSIYGILNGTCNYILTRMEKDGLAFDDVLKEAQALGYAEADPALDIDGFDTAHKAVILASLAYGLNIPMETAYVEGIRDIADLDIKYALDLGYRIKLLAVIKTGDSGVEVRVHPSLVPVDHLLSSVSGVFNAVMIDSDMTGETLYYGKGAGREATASAVIGDIVDVARNISSSSQRRVPVVLAKPGENDISNINDIHTRYYLRLGLQDKPSVLSAITSCLGRHDISIASVLQKEDMVDESYVPVVIVTHMAQENQMAKAIEEIASLDNVKGPVVRFRIEG